MKVVYRNPLKLKPHPDNPRKPKPNGIVELAESLQQNQDYFEARPILLSDRTGELVIIDGEQRCAAAIYLGWDSVPTITMSGLTLEREQEIINRANTHAAEWDTKKLKEKWTADQLKGWGVDKAVWKDKPKQEKAAPVYIFIRCNGENLTLNGKEIKPGETIGIQELRESLK